MFVCLLLLVQELARVKLLDQEARSWRWPALGSGEAVGGKGGETGNGKAEGGAAAGDDWHQEAQARAVDRGCTARHSRVGARSSDAIAHACVRAGIPAALEPMANTAVRSVVAVAAPALLIDR